MTMPVAWCRAAVMRAAMCRRTEIAHVHCLRCHYDACESPSFLCSLLRALSLSLSFCSTLFRCAFVPFALARCLWSAVRLGRAKWNGFAAQVKAHDICVHADRHGNVCMPLNRRMCSSFVSQPVTMHNNNNNNTKQSIHFANDTNRIRLYNRK